MVAITVILAAVIGTFVLGLGDQVQSSAPNANFQFEYDDGGDGFNSGDAGSSTADSLTVTHNGGQDVDPSNIEITVGGTTVYEGGSIEVNPDGSSPDDLQASGAVSTNFGGTVATGSAQQIAEVTSGSPTDYIEGGDDVLVIWQSPNGDSSNTIGSSTVPS
jgi:FlaG/FlaF family flagellin (archaellin)